MDETITKSLKPWVIPAAVGIVSFLGGFGIAHILGKRKLKGILNDLATEAEGIMEGMNLTVVKVNRSRYDTGDPDFDQALVDEDEEAQRQPRRIISSRDPRQILVEEDARNLIEGAPPRPDPTDDDVPHQPHRSQTHPFERLEMDRDWDYEAELSTRTDTAPYILHRDEFMGDEMGFDQSTWTYYKGDDILVDETDTPVYNYQENTGPLRFGHGSGDPNIVYIRNEDLKAEYEVVLNDGHYRVEVLGLEIEERLASEDIRHSAVRKFRDTD